MRPETAKRIVRKAISKTLETGEVADLAPAKEAALKLLSKFDADEIPSGVCLCHQGRPSIGELDYISDRFNAPHRLMFILWAMQSNWKTLGE